MVNITVFNAIYTPKKNPLAVEQSGIVDLVLWVVNRLFSEKFRLEQQAVVFFQTQTTDFWGGVC
jgi:hypothetical protein